MISLDEQIGHQAIRLQQVERDLRRKVFFQPEFDKEKAILASLKGLKRIKELLREPSEEMMVKGDAAIQDGLMKAQIGCSYGLHPDHASHNVLKSGNSALLAQVEREMSDE